MSGVVDGLEVRSSAPVVTQPVKPAKKPKEGNSQFGLKQKLLTYLVLAPLAIIFVAPFAWLVSASFQPMGEIFSL